MNDFKNDSLKWLRALGFLLGGGGGILLLLKYALGWVAVIVGLGMLIAGVLGSPAFSFQKLRENALLFLKAAFSIPLFKKDLKISFRENKFDLCFGLFYFLVLEILLISSLFCSLYMAILQDHFFKLLLGTVVVFSSIAFSSIGVRGYGLCLASKSDRESKRGANMFFFGVVMVVFLFCMMAFTFSGFGDMSLCS